MADAQAIWDDRVGEPGKDLVAPEPDLGKRFVQAWRPSRSGRRGIGTFEPQECLQGR